MTLTELKIRVSNLEPRLAEAPFVEVHCYEDGPRRLHLCLTARLRQKARKGRVWKSKGMLTAMKNAAYGFDEDSPRSRGGRDGIFRLDRGFRPANAMMARLFDGYLDREGGNAAVVAASLGVAAEDLVPVRLVSHHMRLLGVLARKDDDWLVLIDYDDTK